MSASWMKTGEESAQLAEKAKAEAAARQETQGKLFRFFLDKPGKKDKFGKIIPPEQLSTEATVIFADGDLGPKGYLTPPRFYEHMINVGGRWENFPCPKENVPHSTDTCPFCEAKDNPSLVSLFTIIDLRSFTTKKGDIIPFSKKLFVAKDTTFEQLNKLAAKRGGLTGLKIDVSRVGAKAAAVGDTFDVQEKVDIAVAKAKYVRTYMKDGKQVTEGLFVPADYDTEITFRTGDQLRAMGFGAPKGAPSMPNMANPGVVESGEGENYSDQL